MMNFKSELPELPKGWVWQIMPHHDDNFGVWLCGPWDNDTYAGRELKDKIITLDREKSSVLTAARCLYLQWFDWDRKPKISSWDASTLGYEMTGVF